ncbi:hypothetical protein [Bradyrhizobium sp. McL0616]|uniref:hypothetical protein n=1 Tax=Bradyrhizobium sp. McL0616 TaxID=3415674 RepID=UPI003CF297EF
MQHLLVKMIVGAPCVARSVLYRRGFDDRVARDVERDAVRKPSQKGTEGLECFSQD